MNLSRVPSVEPLESRIAPAVIFAGRPGVQADDAEYIDAPFTGTLLATDQIADVVGHEATTYYMRLNTGDILKKFDSAYTNFISGVGGTPLKGSLVAFFRDLDGDGEMDVNELTGISLGKGVSVEISGTVNGDVVSNYNELTQTLGGAAEATGTTAQDLLLNPITIFAATSVTGKIISGGDIKGINLTNTVGSVLTGRAADGVSYNFTQGADGGDTLVVPNVAGAKGVNISNVSAGGITLIQAGQGGAGAIGGTVTNVTLINDSDGFTINAGAGGDGIGGKAGGAGGKLTGIVINGLDEDQTDASANSLMTLAAGRGGNGDGAGKGGVGGDVSGLSLGFELQNGKLQPSINPLRDRVNVDAGAGGNGKIGGAGGKVLSSEILAAPTGAGNNIDVDSGAGGNSTMAGGKAGAGGVISVLDVRNPSAAAGASFININSGDGGTTVVGGGKGANGGMISGATLVGFSLRVTSGDGSDGSLGGGAGGDIKTLVMTEGFLGVRAQNVIVDAGHGGASTVSKGGKGGLIDGFTVLNAQLTQFDVNQTAGSANGGTGAKGGGTGGSISNLNVIDLPDPAGLAEVTMRLRAGTGADGGAGGSFNGNNVIVASKASLLLAAGAGGGGLANKKGGAGGTVNNLSFFTEGTVGLGGATATIDGGTGGAGNGKGAGGLGGSLNTLSIQTDGAVDVASGVGGAGTGAAAAGGGGKVTSIFALSRGGTLVLAASDAGAGGVKAAGGGALNTANLRAATSIDVTSGDGNGGGAGGNITDIGFSDETGAGSPTDFVRLIAGNGSGAGKAAGAGGSITGAAGFIGDGGAGGVAGLSRFVAGNGAAGTTKASAGGSVSDLSIMGGGGATAELQIEAGSAVAAAVKKGGLGGSVKTVGIDDLTAGTIFRRVAAGAGGDSTVAMGVGGQGGSVSDVKVDYDIGVRSGQGFGYNTMGGIFAGQAGLSGAGGKAALAGSVIDVSADAIASIVAGRPVTGDAITARNLVQKVDGLYLNNNVATVVNGNGQYQNFAVANLVGGVVAPTAADVPYDPDANPATPPVLHPHANTFDVAKGEFGDTDASGEFSLGDTITAATDGFVAAVFFNTENSNVAPEAVFMTDPLDGVFKFIDLNNLNGQKVVI